MKVKAPNFEATFGAALEWQNAIGAVIKVYLENRRHVAISGFDAEARAWVLTDSMRHDLWERAKLAWARFTRRSPVGFPYTVDFIATVYDVLISRYDPKRIKAWLKANHPEECDATGES